MKKRGEIWWVNFDPAIGQEVQKSRPSVIVSNNKSNKALKRYQVVLYLPQSLGQKFRKVKEYNLNIFLS